MATIDVHFDLRRLSDRALHLLMRGAGEGERPKTALVRELSDLLTIEKLSREQGQAGPGSPFTIETGIDPGDLPAVAIALENLTDDVAALEFSAALAPAGNAEHDELTVAAEFLFSVAEAIRALRFGTRPS
ncbi:MAG: hypothetical protein WA755_20250 [Candidatus Acidiferrales bacterium]